jgi:hypothetical protein
MDKKSWIASLIDWRDITSDPLANAKHPRLPCGNESRTALQGKNENKILGNWP